MWLGFGRCRRTGLLHRTVAKYAGFDLGEGLLLIDVLSRASLGEANLVPTDGAAETEKVRQWSSL